MTDATATVEREDPKPFVVVESSPGWRGLKSDLLPLMALLGVVYGWVLALLVALVAAVVVVVR